MKKEIGIYLVILAIFSGVVLSCTKQQSGTGEYVIDHYLPGAEPAERVQAVEAKLGPYIEKKIGAKVKLNFVGWGDYAPKLITLTAAGEKIDTAPIFLDSFPYKDYMTRGGVFADISKLLPAEAPELYKLYDQRIWDTMKVNDQIGAIPIMNAYQISWYFNSDLVEKYKFDVSKVEKLNDIEPFLKVIKEKEGFPGAYFTGFKLYYDLLKYYRVLGRVLPWAVDVNDPNAKIVNSYTTPEAMEFFKTVYAFAKKGYIANGEYKPENSPEMQKKWLTEIGFAKPDIEYNQRFGADGKGIYLVKRISTPPYLAPDFHHAVFANSQDVQKTMQYLNLVFTDPLVNATLTYGVEGEDWQALEGNYVKWLPAPQPWVFRDGWAFKIWGNPVNKLREGSPKDLFDRERKELARSIVPVIAAFAPKQDNIKTEIAAISSITNEYVSQFLNGLKDPDVLVKEYTDRINAAGYEKVRAELQKQIDDYLANKK